MVFLKWNKKLSVHMDDIDAQHKRFISIINSVHEKAKDNSDGEKIEDELNQLIEYVRIHFTTEEKYFEEWQYPLAEQHKTAHAELTEKVLDFRKRFDDGEKIISELAEFLKSWLEVHLTQYDKKYSEYFISRGYIK